MPDSVPLGPFAQTFKQCLNCHKEEKPSKFRLLLCKRCVRAHYCNKECQTAHWPAHKVECKSNANALKVLKETERVLASAASPSASFNPREIESRLKRWIQLYRPVLQLALIHALQLQITPQRCTTDILYIILEPNPRHKKPSNIQSEIAHAFRIKETFVASFSKTRELVKEAGLIPDSLLQGTLDRSELIRSQGGSGLALIMISVPAARIMHATPFGFVDSLEIIPLDVSWEEGLRWAVDKGLVM